MPVFINGEEVWDPAARHSCYGCGRFLEKTKREIATAYGSRRNKIECTECGGKEPLAGGG